jgi:hypothetical protein
MVVVWVAAVWAVVVVVVAAESAVESLAWSRAAMRVRTWALSRYRPW